jgi:hypothetical protein
VRGADLRCSKLMPVDVSSDFAWTRPVLGSLDARAREYLCGDLGSRLSALGLGLPPPSALGPRLARCGRGLLWAFILEGCVNVLLNYPLKSK